MAFFKVLALTALLATSALARPQSNVAASLVSFNDEFDQQQGPMFNPHPVYNYAYQVAADDQQTYIAHQEARDGADVQGEYSYVDPYGALVTVTYSAGPDGYQEERNVQDNFVAIRARPVTTVSSNQGLVSQVVQNVRPAIQTVVSQTSSGGNDADLVARIISQLTPFIRDTVTSSLGGSTSSTTTTTTIPEQPAFDIRTAPVPAAAPIQTTSSVVQTQQSAVSNIFGSGGPNNVRVETPDFNFAYDLEK